MYLFEVDAVGEEGQMAVFDKRQETENGDPLFIGPLDFGSIAIDIPDEKERWVGVMFGATHSDLLDRAVQVYVEATDKWAENKDNPVLSQERRLAFVELLRAVSYGCESLAAQVAHSHAEHA